MDKDSVVAWLNSNTEKTDQEIYDFLLSVMNRDDFKEPWQKHYFLENFLGELKSPVNKLSKRTLKIINEVQKEVKGVGMGERGLAFIIDIVVIVLFGYILQAVGIDTTGDSAVAGILSVCIFFLYFSLSIYKFKSTIGLYLLKIKIEFKNNNLLFAKIIARELLWLTTLSGIGFIVFLISGPYWDRITGAHASWLKIKR